MTKKRKIIAIAALLIAVGWLVFIYSNSLQNGTDSGSRSGAISEVVNDILGLPNTPEQLEVTGHYVRKSAHFTEFFIEGALLFVAVFAYLDRCFFGGGCALIITSALAAIDESLQSFVPDRGPAVADWALDTSAAFCSVLILAICSYFIFKRVKR